MTLIFFGSDPWFSPPVLEALLKAGHQVLAVVTKGSEIAERLQTTDYGRNIQIIQATTSEDISRDRLESLLSDLHPSSFNLQPSVIVLAAFGPPFLGNDILNWPKHGCLNVHASLLPRHRGASPVFAALAAGDKETGVTIMRMTEEIDRGPILGQSRLPIWQPDVLKVPTFDTFDTSDTSDTFSFDTRESLTKRLGTLGGELIVETLEKIESNTLVEHDQPEKSPTPYTRRLTKESGRIDWSKSPIEIERFIRAVTPWPGAVTNAKFKVQSSKWQTIQELKILKAHVETYCPTGLSTYQPLLVPDEVQIPGKNPITWKAFLAGHPNTQLR